MAHARQPNRKRRTTWRPRSIRRWGFRGRPPGRTAARGPMRFTRASRWAGCFARASGPGGFRDCAIPSMQPPEAPRPRLRDAGSALPVDQACSYAKQQLSTLDLLVLSEERDMSTTGLWLLGAVLFAAPPVAAEQKQPKE